MTRATSYLEVIVISEPLPPLINAYDRNIKRHTEDYVLHFINQKALLIEGSDPILYLGTEALKLPPADCPAGYEWIYKLGLRWYMADNTKRVAAL